LHCPAERAGDRRFPRSTLDADGSNSAQWVSDPETGGRAQVAAKHAENGKDGDDDPSPDDHGRVAELADAADLKSSGENAEVGTSQQVAATRASGGCGYGCGSEEKGRRDDADLAQVVDAWPHLADAIRKAILALVAASE